MEICVSKTQQKTYRMDAFMACHFHQSSPQSHASSSSPVPLMERWREFKWKTGDAQANEQVGTNGCECYTDHTLAHPLNCRGGVVARFSA